MGATIDAELVGGHPDRIARSQEGEHGIRRKPANLRGVQVGPEEVSARPVEKRFAAPPAPRALEFTHRSRAHA